MRAGVGIWNMLTDVVMLNGCEVRISNQRFNTLEITISNGHRAISFRTYLLNPRTMPNHTEQAMCRDIERIVSELIGEPLKTMKAVFPEEEKLLEGIE